MCCSLPNSAAFQCIAIYKKLQSASSLKMWSNTQKWEKYNRSKRFHHRQLAAEKMTKDHETFWPAKAKILMTSPLALSGVYLMILICSWVSLTSVSPRLATHKTQESNNTQNTRINCLPRQKTKQNKKPRCSWLRLGMRTYLLRTLKIPQSMSEFGGSQKHENTQHASYVARLRCSWLSSRTSLTARNPAVGSCGRRN